MHNPPTHQPRASKSLRSLLAQSVCLVGDGNQPQNQPPTLALGSCGRRDQSLGSRLAVGFLVGHRCHPSESQS